MIAGTSGFTTELVEVARYPAFERDWKALEAEADFPPFQAWPWVETWLATLPPRIRPIVFRATDPEGLLALALLVDAPRSGRSRLIGGRIARMQMTGERALDDLTIEYGGLLARRGQRTAAYAALFTGLDRAGWRRTELRIPVSADGGDVRSVLPATWRLSARLLESPAYLVDLAGIRTAGGSYLAALSASTRSGLRQTRRAYERLGPIRFEIARDVATALDWLGRLAELHTRHWRALGYGGAFAGGHFRCFHETLFRQHFDSGLPRICRVLAGDVEVGYYYHLVHRGGIYCYNGGNRPNLVPRNDRPGFLVHWLAIERALADGCGTYDFLTGTGSYKRMMSTHVRPVEVLRMWRSRWWANLTLRFNEPRPPGTEAPEAAGAPGAMIALRR